MQYWAEIGDEWMEEGIKSGLRFVFTRKQVNDLEPSKMSSQIISCGVCGHLEAAGAGSICALSGKLVLKGQKVCVNYFSRWRHRK